MAEFRQIFLVPEKIKKDELFALLESFGKLVEETEPIETKFEFVHEADEVSLTFIRSLENSGTAGRTIIIRPRVNTNRFEIVFLSEVEFDTHEIYKRLFEPA